MPKPGNPSDREAKPTPRRRGPRRVHRLLSSLAKRVSAPLLATALLASIACGTAESVASGEVVLNESALRVFEGTFTSLVHPTEGTLRIEVDTDENARAIFLGDFMTDNGPALVVGLSTTRAEEMTNGNAWPIGAISLGSLKGASGAQAYEIPAGTDLDTFRSVVVWCEDFSVAFGAASYADVESL
jgi:hypothetical protein